MSKTFLMIVAIGTLALAGCGGGGNSSSDTSSAAKPAETTTTSASSGGGGNKLALVAVSDGLKYDKSSLSASAGKVTIEMKNDSGLSHDVSVKGNGVDEQGDAVGQGETSTVSADLKPGTYEYYCSVDGHEGAGMKGDLTVK